MEPRIQYAKTADGVSIAFWTLGEGMPLVYMPWNPWSHVQLEWQVPEFRYFYEHLAATRKLIRYDGRGTGLSERNVTDFSLQSQVLDLEAVVDRLRLEQVAVLGLYGGGPVAIAYAARRPELVSRLVLWCAVAQGSEWYRSPQIHSLIALRGHDWETYTETIAHAVFGWSAGDQAHRFAAFFRECVTPEAVRAAFEAMLEFDATDFLPRVSCPTLVLQRRQIPFPHPDVATGLASRIPDARLVLLEGTATALMGGETEPVLQAIDEFLGESEEAAAGAEPPEPGGFRTILFTDVEGSTALTQRLGDARAREVLRAHERIVREALKAHGGAEVKTMGDGFMASFSSGTRALECAVAMQRAFAEHNAALLRQAQDEHTEPRAEPVEAPVEVRIRIGLNAGEPIAEEDDLFGTAVIRAARIAAMAQGGEILVANVVRELVEGKGFLFADRGETALRGFDDPVRLFEVRWQG